MSTIGVCAPWIPDLILSDFFRKGKGFSLNENIIINIYFPEKGTV